LFTFSELKSNVATLAQRAGDSDYIIKIGIWVNLAQNFLFNIYDYFNELQDVHNFTTVDEQEDYPMPNRFDKPLRIYDLTNDKKIEIITEEKYFDANVSAIADADEEAAPSFARIYGTKGITGAIGVAGSIVKVKSSSVSDTASVIVRIEGYLNSLKTIIGYENITISAGTPTTYVSGVVTFYDIIHVSKSDDTIGYITLADSADAVLEYMSPTDRVMRHKVLKLGKIPNQENSMRVLFKKRINKLVNDYDYPFIECDDYLILDAWGWALSQDKETIDKSITTWAKAKEALSAILANQNSKLGPSYIHRMTSMWASAHRA